MSKERINLTTGTINDEIEDLIVNHGCSVSIISEAFGIPKTTVKRFVADRNVFYRRYNVEMWTSIARAAQAINTGIMPIDFGIRKPHTGELYPELFEFLEEIFIEDCIRSSIISQTFNITKGYIRNRLSKHRVAEIQKLKMAYDAVIKHTLMVRDGFLEDPNLSWDSIKYQAVEYISQRAADISKTEEDF